MIVRINSDDDRESFIEIHRDDQGDSYLMAVNSATGESVNIRLCGPGGGSRCPVAVRKAVKELAEIAEAEGLSQERGYVIFRKRATQQ